MTTQPPDLKKLREVRDFLREWEFKGRQTLYEGTALDMADTIDAAIDAYEASARDAESYKHGLDRVIGLITYVDGEVLDEVDPRRIYDAIHALTARHATQGD